MLVDAEQGPLGGIAYQHGKGTGIQRRWRRLAGGGNQQYGQRQVTAAPGGGEPLAPTQGDSYGLQARPERGIAGRQVLLQLLKQPPAEQWIGEAVGAVPAVEQSREFALLQPAGNAGQVVSQGRNLDRQGFGGGQQRGQGVQFAVKFRRQSAGRHGQGGTEQGPGQDL